MNGHNSPGSTRTEESKKRSKNNAIGGRSVNIGVDSLTAAPVGNEGQRLNDWMQRRIAQTKNDGVNFTQRKGGDVPKQRMRCEETEVRAELRTRGQAFKVRSPRQARPGQDWVNDDEQGPDARGKDIGGPHETRHLNAIGRDQQRLTTTGARQTLPLFQLRRRSGYASNGTPVNWRGRCSLDQSSWRL